MNIFKYIFIFVVFIIVGKIIMADRQQQSKYVLYHIGAEWCAPCEKMKKEIWDKDRHPEVFKFLKENDIELHIIEATNEKHKKYISYYNISVFPTLVLVERKKLKTPVFKMQGFATKDTVLKSLTKNVMKD